MGADQQGHGRRRWENRSSHWWSEGGALGKQRSARGAMPSRGWSLRKPCTHGPRTRMHPGAPALGPCARPLQADSPEPGLPVTAAAAYLTGRESQRGPREVPGKARGSQAGGTQGTSKGELGMYAQKRPESGQKTPSLWGSEHPVMRSQWPFQHSSPGHLETAFSRKRRPNTKAPWQKESRGGVGLFITACGPACCPWDTPCSQGWCRL